MSELRRAMMAKKLGGGLPPGVVLYERLIGDGTAYIDTGFVPTESNLLGFEMAGRLVNKNTILFGTCNSSYSAGYVEVSANGTYLRVGLCGALNSITRITGNDIEVKCEQVGNNMVVDYSIDGVQGSLTTSNAKATYNQSLPLFARRIQRSGIAGISPNGASLKFLKLFAMDGSLMYNFHPCTYNGEAGMWDLVSNTFFGNANTSGSFSVAND